MKMINSILLGLFVGAFSVCAKSAEDIAYLAVADGYWQVWVMDADGVGNRQLTRSPFDKNTLSWFPGCRDLLVGGTQGEVRKVAIERDNEQVITFPIEGVTTPQISHRGNVVVFSIMAEGDPGNHDLWKVNIDGTGLVQLTNRPGLQFDPVWGNEPNELYYLSGRGGQENDIWRLDMGSGVKEQITVGSVYNFDVAVSPKGDLAFSSNRAGNYDIWIGQEDHTFKRISDHPDLDGRPSWSPDAEFIAFESSRGGQMNIWRLNIATGELFQLTDSETGARYPTWKSACESGQR